MSPMVGAAPKRGPEGVTLRHRSGCPGGDDNACRCRPSYQAQVFSSRERRTIRKTFQTLSDARAWRADSQSSLRKGTLRAPTRTTLAEAADDWLEAAKTGTARTRSGDRYKPSALRSYEEALRTKVLARKPSTLLGRPRRRPGHGRPPSSRGPRPEHG